MSIFKQGDEIIYIPYHANGDKNHPDCERGFVTSIKGDTIFCRFYIKNGKSDFYGLRTIANSEGCNHRDLYFVATMSSQTKKILEIMRSNSEKFGFVE